MIMPNKSYKLHNNHLQLIFEYGKKRYTTKISTGEKAIITYYDNELIKQLYGKINKFSLNTNAKGNDQLIFQVNNIDIIYSSIISIDIIENSCPDNDDYIPHPENPKVISLKDLLLDDMDDLYIALNAEDAFREIGTKVKNLIEEGGGGSSTSIDDTDLTATNKTLSSAKIVSEINKSNNTVLDKINQDIKNITENKYLEFNKVLFYYGKLFPTGDVNTSLSLYSTYDIIVPGFNDSDPQCIADLATIISYLKENSPNTKVFLYIDIGSNDSITKLKSKINKCVHLGGALKETINDVEIWEGGISAHGIFLDSAGYDYNVTRQRQNAIIDYCHDNNLLVFINAWMLDSLFSTDTALLMTNGKVANPTGDRIHLAADDYFLYEANFFMANDDGTTTIRPIVVSKRPYDYNNKYYNEYGCKGICLNSVGKQVTPEQLQIALTYSVITSLIMGAAGCAMSYIYWGADDTYIPWSMPDYINTYCKEKTMHICQRIQNGIYKSTINGHILESFQLNGNTNDNLTMTDENIKNIYLLLDGGKTQNAWISVYTIMDEINSKTFSYNDEAAIMKPSALHSQPGISNTAARADHRHEAGTYLRLKEDAANPKTFTNYLAPLKEWEIPDYISGAMEDYSFNGTLGVTYGYIRSPKLDLTNLKGKTIEIGVTEMAVPVGSETATNIEVIYGGNTSTINVTKHKPSYCGNKSGFCRQLDIPIDFADSIRIRISTSSSDQSIMFKNIYVYEISELDDKTWYTNKSPKFELFDATSSTAMSKEILGDHSIKLTFNEAWQEFRTYLESASLAGKNLQFGVKVKSVTGDVRISLTATKASGSSVDLGSIICSDTNYNDSVYDESKQYLAHDIAMQDELYLDIRLRIYSPYGNASIEIDDFYLYDTRQELLSEDDIYSDSFIQFRRVATLPETLNPNTLYLTMDEKLVLTDSNNKSLALGNFKSDIPKLFLEGNISIATKDAEAWLDFMYTSKEKSFNGACKAKWQGNSSLAFPKKNYTIKLYDTINGEKLNVSMFGWGNQNKYCLKANYIDFSQARNIVSARIWSDIVSTREYIPKLLKESPHYGAIDGYPIELFVNGKSQGIYTWNIPKDGWMFNMDDSITTHTILCAETHEGACAFRDNALIDGTDWSLEFPDNLYPETLESFNNMINHIKDTTNEDFVVNFNKYLDLEACIDYYIYSFFMCHLDGLGKNMLMITYDGIKWFPSMYDMDTTWGLYIDGIDFVPYSYLFPNEYNCSNSLLWQRLRENFAQQIYDRLQILKNNGVLTIGHIIYRFEEFINAIPQKLYDKDKMIWTEIPKSDIDQLKQLEDFIVKRYYYADAVINSYVNTNKFNPKLVEADYFIDTGNGTKNPDSNYYTSAYMPAEEGKEYTMSNSGWSRIAYYDKDEKFIRGYEGDAPLTGFADAYTRLARISFNKSCIEAVTFEEKEKQL